MSRPLESHHPLAPSRLPLQAASAPPHLVPLGLGGVAVDSGLGLAAEEAEGVDLQGAVEVWGRTAETLSRPDESQAADRRQEGAEPAHSLRLCFRPEAEWTMTFRKPWRPEGSSSGDTSARSGWGSAGDRAAGQERHLPSRPGLSSARCTVCSFMQELVSSCSSTEVREVVLGPVHTHTHGSHDHMTMVTAL